MDEPHVLNIVISAILVPIVSGTIAVIATLWRKIQKTECLYFAALETNKKMGLDLATMKSFIQSRALLEAIRQGRMAVGGGVGSFDEEFTKVFVKDREREAFADLMPELMAWYTDGSRNIPAPCTLSNDNLFMAIMRDWDGVFVHTVCAKLDVANAACCLYAMCLLKETHETKPHGVITPKVT
jgi:hypothetical protein